MAGALQSLVAVFSLPGSLLRRCGRYVALFTCILVASHIPPAQAQAGVERVKSLWETRRAYVKTGRFRYWLLDDSTPHALKTEQLDCDSPPLSDSGGDRIMVPDGGLNDERFGRGRVAAYATV